MSFVLRRTYLKLKNNVIHNANKSKTLPPCNLVSRNFSDIIERDHEYCSTTVLVENSLNVQELPVIVRKVRDLSDFWEKPAETATSSTDSHSYQIIQAEFKECLTLREVFSFLSKCTSITPNIALGAMERIYFIENHPNLTEPEPFRYHINNAKGAILDKLLKVMMSTEDTQTLLNALAVDSSFITPYKYSFCLELLLRVTDNKVSLDQLCNFVSFLIKNNDQKRYSEIIEKLWIGFIQREVEVNAVNIVTVYQLIPYLKDTRRIILNMLERKLVEFWSVIKTPEMLDILSVYMREHIWAPHSFAVIGRWLQTNIHSLNDDSLLEIMTKFQKLNYSDDQVIKAVAKYLKMKNHKIESPILIVGILNYCMQLQIRNEAILQSCSEYFTKNSSLVPHRFLKSILYPFGFLHYDPGEDFWVEVENIVDEKYEMMSANDIASIILSFLFVNKHPLKLINRLLSSINHLNDNDVSLKKMLHFIDTALCLQCPEYCGPLLPKIQYLNSAKQDVRIKNLLEKIDCVLNNVAGGPDRFTLAFSIPHLYTDETNMIDIMLHPETWKLNSAKNDNVAILIHLPEHYCFDDQHLIGPQITRIRHLKSLGMKVVSLKYSMMQKYYTTYNNEALEKYIRECLKNLEW